MTHFQELEDKLKVPPGINNMYNKALTLFNIDDINLIDIDIIETEKSKVLWEVTGVQTKFIKFYDINDEDYKIRWEKIFENLYYLDRFIRTTYYLECHRIIMNIR